MVAVVLYQTGVRRHRRTCRFPNSTMADEWIEDVVRVKDTIEDINNDGNAGEARVPHYRNWLNLVDNFIIQWGRVMVPLDVREAVNDVEGQINHPLTRW